MTVMLAKQLASTAGLLLHLQLQGAVLNHESSMLRGTAVNRWVHILLLYSCRLLGLAALYSGWQRSTAWDTVAAQGCVILKVHLSCCEDQLPIVQLSDRLCIWHAEEGSLQQSCAWAAAVMASLPAAEGQPRHARQTVALAGCSMLHRGSRGLESVRQVDVLGHPVELSPAL